MSDTVLRLYAADPAYAPDPTTAVRAEDAARALFPGADEIDVEVYPRVTLIDCGENLQRIRCPHCGAPIALEWWGDRLDELTGDGGWERAEVDAPLAAPCCGRDVTIGSLVYDWPVGFARFTVDVWNPDPWPERDDATQPAVELGETLGVPLRGLWAHY